MYYIFDSRYHFNEDSAVVLDTAITLEEAKNISKDLNGVIVDKDGNIVC